MHARTFWLAGCALLALIVCQGCAKLVPPGMKLLNVEIERDGELVLETGFDAPDHESDLEVVSRLGEGPIFATDVAGIPGPSPLVLESAIRVRVRHVERVLADAELDGLELVGDAPPRYFLGERELERVLRAAGL